jgi:hypothetical protein
LTLTLTLIVARQLTGDQPWPAPWTLNWDLKGVRARVADIVELMGERNAASPPKHHGDESRDGSKEGAWATGAPAGSWSPAVHDTKHRRLEGQGQIGGRSGEMRFTYPKRGALS